MFLEYILTYTVMQTLENSLRKDSYHRHRRFRRRRHQQQNYQQEPLDGMLI